MDIFTGLLIALSSYFGYGWYQTDSELTKVLEKGEIHVEKETLSNVDKQIKVQIDIDGTYYLDTSEIEELSSLLFEHKALYQWEYTLNFGYDFTDDWKWCDDTNQDNQEVVLNVPEITEFKLNKASIKERILDGSWSSEKVVSARSYAEKRVDEAINIVRKKYLDNEQFKEAISIQFSEKVKDLLNSAHYGHNPISKVILETRTCG